MGNKRKWGPFIISHKINNAVQVDTHIGTHVELASHFTISVSKQNTGVKICQDTERRYVQCGQFSK